MTQSQAYSAFHSKGHGLFLHPDNHEEFKLLLKDWEKCHTNFRRLLDLKPEYKREYTAGLHQACHEIVEKAVRLS